MAITIASLPFGFRPAVDAIPQPPASGLSWTGWLILLGLILVGIALLWRQQGQRRQPITLATESADRWTPLEQAVGSRDWYARLGAHLLAEARRTDQGIRSLDALLAHAADRDSSGAWRHLQRRWEWATFADHPGHASDHLTDLATARRGWP